MKRKWTTSMMSVLALAAVVLWSATAFALTASQQVIGAGGEITVITTIEYNEALTALGVRVKLPAGWTFKTVGGSDVPAVAPAEGASGEIDFAWIAAPAGPAMFAYTLAAPQGGTARDLAAEVVYRVGAGEEQVVVVE